MNTAIILYSLIIVTNAGDVHHADDFQSLSLCKDAESLARYGKTVGEKKAADDKAEKARKQFEKDWNRSHPPRPPKDDFERSIAEAGRLGSIVGSVWGASVHSAGNGLVQDDPILSPSGWSRIISSPDPNQVKWSACVKFEPGENP